LENFKNWLTSGYDAKKADSDLRKIFTESIQQVGAPVKDADELTN
jgi:hypothetical protein